jgi:hypothetical protein
LRTVPYIHEIVERIVSDIREYGSITSSSETSTGVYTITSDNNLIDNDFVTIDSVEYKVYNTTSTTFDIEAATGLDFTGLQWDANEPYYMHEKEPKANEILSQKTGKQKWQKYPLVLLLHPYTIDRGSINYAEYNDVRIAILTNTKTEWNSDQRYTNNFDNTLEPIYDKVIDGLLNAEEFTFENHNVPHERTDALFLDGNPLPDELDAILIEFDSLPVNYVDSCEDETDEYVLTMSSDDESQGLTLPEIGAHIYKEASTETLYPVPKTGFEWVKWQIDGVDNTTENPQITFDKNYVAKAFFQALFQTIQNVFITTPVTVGKHSYYLDSVSNANMKITNIQSFQFNGDVYLRVFAGTENTPARTNSIVNTLHYISDTLPTANETLLTFSNNVVGGIYYAIYIGTNGKLNLKISTGDGTNYEKLNFSDDLSDGKEHIILHDYDTEVISVSVDGETLIDGESLTIPFSTDHFNQIALGNLLRGNSGKLWLFKGVLNYFKQDGFCELTMQGGSGDMVYDRSTFENDFTVIDTSATQWDTFRNTKPYCTQLGFTAFEKDSDSSILNIPYVGTSPRGDIAGYTRKKDYPTPTGMPNYLSDKVSQPSEINLIVSGGQSNWDGNFSPSLLPASLQGEQQNIFQWDGSDFAVYNPNLKTFAGFPPYLLPKLRDYNGQPIYYQETWARGTMLDQSGTPFLSYPKQTLLDESLAAYNKLKELFPISGIRIHVIWVQGYTDAQDETISLRYEDNLRDLFADLRTQFGNAIKMHYNILNVNANGSYVTNVRTAQTNVEDDSIYNIMYNFDSIGFDGVHYTQPGFEEGANILFDGIKDDLQGTASPVKDDNILRELSDANGWGWYDSNGVPIPQSYDDINALINGANLTITKETDKIIQQLVKN